MDATDDRRPINARNSLRLDLSAVKDSPHTKRHDGPSSCLAPEPNASPPSGKGGRLPKKHLAESADASASAERSAVELLAVTANSRSHRASGADAGVCNLLSSAGVAGAVSNNGKNSGTVNGNNGTRRSSVSNDSQRGSSSIGAAPVGNAATNNNRRLNLADKSKRQGEQVSPPNSSPARLEGPVSKCARSALQNPESPTTACGPMSVSVDDRKALSFTAVTNTRTKTRITRRLLATHTTAKRLFNASLEKFTHGSSRKGGRSESLFTAEKVSGLRRQQTESEIAQREGAQGGQQNDEREGPRSQASGDSEDEDEQEEQDESRNSDSGEAESLDTSAKEEHSESGDDEQDQDSAKAYPAVVEMDLDDADEEDYPEGELRYNMRTGKFSKAYVVRGAASHRTFPKRRTIVAGEKGPEPSWIFPWEPRPEVDVFAAATAATAASSARRQGLPPSGHSGSARLNAYTSSHSLSPERAPGRRLREAFCVKGKPHFRQSQGRDAEEEKKVNMMINERQKESVFDCLSKMAQANEWAQMLKINRNYRAFKTREGKLACHVYQGKSYVKRLPVEVFMSYEYPRLRRRFMLCCPYLHLQTQMALNSNMNDTEVRMRRELELQNVLLSTIQLTHALREQLDFLQRVSNVSPRTQLL